MKRTYKSLLLASCVASAWTVGAHAQQPAARTNEAANSDTDSSGHLQEIVVTAQRRSENLQRVPITLTAVTADTIKNSSLVTTRDLTMIVPGLVIGNQGPATQTYIRGIGTNGSTAGIEPAVATYVDGVVFISGVSGMVPISSVERVEVLKGPQGTLWGRNATGGAINIITRDPSETPHLEAEIGYGNHKAVMGSLYATTGLAPGISINIAADATHMDEGFGHNIVTGSDANYERRYNFRSKLMMKNEDSRIVLSGFYSSDRGDEASGYRRINPPGFRASGTLLDNQFGWNNGFWDYASAFDQTGHVTMYGFTGRLEQDLGRVRLVSITGWTHLDQQSYQNIADVPFLYWSADISEGGHTFTQEVQLQSNIDDSRLKWIVGAFYMNGRIDRNLNSSGPLASNQGPNIIMTSNPSHLNTKSMAGFAHAVYEAFDNTRVTAGIRYTSDRKQLFGEAFRTLGGPGKIYNVPDVVNDATPTGTFYTLNPTKTAPKRWKTPTWTLGVDHQFTPDVMGYVTYNRGFKAGTFATGSLTTPPVFPEKVDTFEGGLKTQLLDRRLRLNFSIFHNDYSNLQLARTVLNAQGNAVSLLFNAAAARSYGLDAEFTAIITPFFSLTGGAEFLHSKYTRFPDAPCLVPRPVSGGVGGYINTGAACDVKGNDTIRSPRFSGNLGGDVHFPVGPGKLLIHADYSYRSSFYFEADNRLKQAPLNMVNGSIKYEIDDGRYHVRAWSRNLTNEKYCKAEVTISPFGDICSPAFGRQFGLAIGASL